MFKDLKQNSTVYIIRKDNGLKVSVANVKDIQPPHIDAMAYGKFNQMANDISIELNGKIITFAVPEGLSVTYSNEGILCSDRDNLLKELESLKQQSENVISNIPEHERIIADASELLAEYSPDFRQKKETEERFAKLENGMSEMKDMFKSLLSELRGES